MNRATNRILISLFGILAVGYPLWVRISSVDWALDGTLIGNLFPTFGILAFTLLWLHSMSGVFEPWLRKQFDFNRYVHITSIIILISFVSHPLLLFIQMGSQFTMVFTNWNLYIYLGITGFLLLLTYDIAKFLKYGFFVRNWNKILVISTIGFLLIFFHSLNLGSNLQSGPLRKLWIFYGVTAILATVYTYGVKKFYEEIEA